MEHEDGSVGMGTLVSYDISIFLTMDEEGRLVASQDPRVWSGFEASVVHEFMHAFMANYNRTGITGYNDPRYESAKYDPDDEDVDYYTKIRASQLMFPDWFREGTAATVDSNYSAMYDYFKTMTRRRPQPMAMRRWKARSDFHLSVQSRSALDEPAYALIVRRTFCSSE